MKRSGKHLQSRRPIEYVLYVLLVAVIIAAVWAQSALRKALDQPVKQSSISSEPKLGSREAIEAAAQKDVSSDELSAASGDEVLLDSADAGIAVSQSSTEVFSETSY